ncbi:MAG: hypothetical protein H6981_15510 [Gammaproteobacteria bacterium]|nr:hypothetical protein [Gammaproteobacteria bacterium]MCP5138193.1 hypothetical protein [Gammaproteobacteria bacterium]
MAEWLVENFIWVGLGIVVLLVGIKVVIGGMLKKLMDDSAAANADASNQD